MVDPTIAAALESIFAGIESLRVRFPHKEFTIDGRLVGDIGEVIAEHVYEIELFEKLEKDYDAVTSDGKLVQIKATFRDSLTFKKTPDWYLGLLLREDGSYEEIFNGPGSYIFDAFSHRKGIGETLLSFSNSRLREIASQVPPTERIPRRQSES